MQYRFTENWDSFGWRSSVMALTLAVVTTGMTGCAKVGPYQPPEIALSPSFVAPVAIADSDPVWWMRFNDPLLNDIVARVRTENLDLAAASSRVEQARAMASGAAANGRPQIGGAASAEESVYSRNSPIGSVAGALGQPRNNELYQIGVQASWELDLFGKFASGNAAADAQVGEALALAEAVKLSVTAEAVDAYLQLRIVQAQLETAQQQLDNRASFARLVGMRYREGLSSQREYELAMAQVAEVEASIPMLRTAIATHGHRLDVLMGSQAGTMAATLAAVRPIPAALQPSGSANPAELMRRRPDLVAAERRVAFANANIAVEMAEYYPQVSFNGLLSLLTMGGSSLLTGDAVQAVGGGGLRWRLFDFGRIDARVAVARGREAEALIDYRAAALGATEEVENALVRIVEGQRTLQKCEERVRMVSGAADKTRLAFQHGAVSFIDVLDVERQLLDAGLQLQLAKGDLARASLASVRALGGGYSAPVR